MAYRSMLMSYHTVSWHFLFVLFVGGPRSWQRLHGRVASPEFFRSAVEGDEGEWETEEEREEEEEEEEEEEDEEEGEEEEKMDEEQIKKQIWKKKREKQGRIHGTRCA